MISDVVSLRIGRHQFLALLKIRSNHERFTVLMQPHEQLAAYLERRRAVGHPLFHVVQRKRNLANSIERRGRVYGLTTLLCFFLPWRLGCTTWRHEFLENELQKFKRA